MEIFIPYIDPEEPAIYESPFMRVDYGDEELILDHLNSLVRIFPDELVEFNHVEMWPDADSEVIGMEMPQHIILNLIENDWPKLWLPFVDTRTRSWYERCQESKMLKELGSMGLNLED